MYFIYGIRRSDARHQQETSPMENGRDLRIETPKIVSDKEDVTRF